MLKIGVYDLRSYHKIMRIIIMAGGKAKRWTGDKPKQLTEFFGEPLLKRTIRLLSEAKVLGTDIVVTMSRELSGIMRTPEYREKFDGYPYNAVTGFVSDDNIQEIDRFLSCKSQWEGDTIFLYGDVFYTDEAINKILSTFLLPVTFFGRRRGNNMKPYGEMFGLRADTSDPKFENILLEIRAREKNGEARGLGWDVYRAYNKSNFVELDARLEDFDKVEEVNIYKKIYGIA